MARLSAIERARVLGRWFIKYWKPLQCQQVHDYCLQQWFIITGITADHPRNRRPWVITVRQDHQIFRQCVIDSKRLPQMMTNTQLHPYSKTPTGQTDVDPGASKLELASVEGGSLHQWEPLLHQPWWWKNLHVASGRKAVCWWLYGGAEPALLSGVQSVNQHMGPVFLQRKWSDSWVLHAPAADPLCPALLPAASTATQDYVQQHSIPLMLWLSLNLNLNIIKYLWDQLQWSLSWILPPQPTLWMFTRPLSSRCGDEFHRQLWTVWSTECLAGAKPSSQLEGVIQIIVLKMHLVVFSDSPFSTE